MHNRSGLDAVKSVLLKRSTNTPPVECILEGLDLCLTCNSFFLIIYNISYKLMVQYKDHMSCSYSNIGMSKFDTAALQYHLKPTLFILR